MGNNRAWLVDIKNIRKGGKYKHEKVSPGGGVVGMSFPEAPDFPEDQDNILVSRGDREGPPGILTARGGG